MTMELIDKAAVKAEIERIEHETNYEPFTDEVLGKRFVCRSLLSFLNTLEVKEVDIASMADEYYDALIKEAEMDVDMAGHCRLAYYNGCKDVLNKIQKGE